MRYGGPGGKPHNGKSPHAPGGGGHGSWSASARPTGLTFRRNTSTAASGRGAPPPADASRTAANANTPPPCPLPPFAARGRAGGHRTPVGPAAGAEAVPCGRCGGWVRLPDPWVLAEIAALRGLVVRLWAWTGGVDAALDRIDDRLDRVEGLALAAAAAAAGRAHDRADQAGVMAVFNRRPRR
jgi:hypothetical protein